MQQGSREWLRRIANVAGFEKVVHDIKMEIPARDPADTRLPLYVVMDRLSTKAQCDRGVLTNSFCCQVTKGCLLKESCAGLR